MKYEKGSFTTIPNIKIVTGEHPVTQAVYMHLCHRANQYGICFPSIRQIAEDVGSSKNTVRKYLGRLIELGVLEKKRRKKGLEETSSEYQIIVNLNYDSGPTTRVELPSSLNGGPTLGVGDGTKETKLNNNFNNTNVLLKEDKEYGDSDINNILKAIKDNNDGLIDGTQNSSRKFGKLLKDKILKIKGFNGDFYYFIDRLIKNTDDFRISKTTSPENLYYNLASLIAIIRAKKEGKMSFERGGKFNFLGKEEENIVVN